MLSKSAVASGTIDDHIFVSNIRHWAMFAIIFIHCAILSTGFGYRIPSAVYSTMALAKFGSIGFFLISGFLLGERFDKTGRMEYLLRRLRRIVVPWALWFTFFCAIRPIGLWLVRGHNVLEHSLGSSLWAIYDALVGTAYWFVPVMVVSLSVLLLFSRYIDNWKFGAAAFAISIFYGINVYERWIPTYHSTAFLGYISYLWLGAWSSRNWTKVKSFIDALPAWLLAIAALVFWNVAMFETSVLSRLGNPDTLNSLRVSNQAYGLIVVMLLLKIRGLAVWPTFVNAREHTFGLYLTHMPVAKVVVVVMQKIALFQAAWFSSPVGVFGLVVIFFVVTYTISLSITALLASSTKMAWIVGATSKAAVKRPALVPVPASRAASIGQG